MTLHRLRRSLVELTLHVPAEESTLPATAEVAVQRMLLALECEAIEAAGGVVDVLA